MLMSSSWFGTPQLLLADLIINPHDVSYTVHIVDPSNRQLVQGVLARAPRESFGSPIGISQQGSIW